MDEHPSGAEYAGVSRSTIGRWMDDGMVYHRLNHNNVRIHPDDVDAFIRRFKVGVDAEVKTIMGKIRRNK